ncbi:MAG: hypothetical protein O3C07_02570, partial [Bacteroidetes bacterium]|nr:hypothetical protein [Bacteroidota bacterium]
MRTLLLPVIAVLIFNYNFAQTWPNNPRPTPEYSWSGENLSDMLGTVVAVSGDGNTVAFHRYGSFFDGRKRAVFVYKRSGNSWIPKGGLPSGGSIGETVTGSSSIITHPTFDGGNLGISYTDLEGWSETEVISLSENGNTIAIGVPGNDDSDVGKVYISEYNEENDSWGLITTLSGQRNSDSTNQYFGKYIKLSDDGTFLAISVPNAIENNNADGDIEFYKLQNGQWTYKNSLDDETFLYTPLNKFDLSGDGTTIAFKTVFGGSTYITTRSINVDFTTSHKATSVQKESDNNGSSFPTKISLSDNGRYLAISTANHDNDPSVNYKFGRVDTYELSGDGTSYVNRGSTIFVDEDDDRGSLTSDMELSGDGSTLLFASRHDGSICSSCNTSDATNTRMFIYNWNDTDWSKVKDITTPADGNRNTTGTYGETLSISNDGSTIIAGEHDQDSNRGFVELFYFDLTPPDITISATGVSSAEVSSGNTSNDSTLSLTFTTSEATTNFVEADITLSNASLSNFTGS